MAEVLRDRRHQRYITHDFLELLSQRVFQIVSGYEDANDCNDLRKDPIIKIACNKLPDSEEELGSQPTVSRFENAPSRTDLCRLGEALVELFIKEHKNHLFSDRTSCSSFEANQFRLFLHSIGYVLLHTYRELYLWGTEFAKAQVDTIRLKLIKIGARVRQMSTRIKVHLPSSFPLAI